MLSAPSLCGVFGSDGIGAVVQEYTKHLVEERGCKWSTTSTRVGAFLSVSRFVHAARMARATPGATVSSAPVEQLAAIHRACSGPGLRRAMFSATLPTHVEALARKVLKKPLEITVGERNTAATNVAQKILIPS